MKASLTAQEEDELSRLLSDLTPMAYYQLLKKVDRSKWHVKGIEKSGFFHEYIKGAKRNKKNKIEDPYPIAMPVEILSKHLNLPDLQFMVDDIRNNYLKRPATKKYILIDYPEKFVLKKDNEGKQRPHSISLPPALLSLLPKETTDIIYEEWKKRFPVFTH